MLASEHCTDEYTNEYTQAEILTETDERTKLFPYELMAWMSWMTWTFLHTALPAACVGL